MATVIGSAAISAATTAAIAARSGQTTVIVIQNQPAVPAEVTESHAGAVWLAMGIIVFLLVAIFKD